MQRSDRGSLWIVRHGRAEPASASGHDTDRALDSQGLRQAEWLGTVMTNPALRPSSIVASPAVRTWTTARVIGTAIDIAPVECPRLSCEHQLSHAVEVIAELLATMDPPRLAVVGHNPTVSELLGWLVDGMGRPRKSLRTGEAVLVEFAAGTVFDQPGGAEMLQQCRRKGGG